jgi:hypothetical protein
MCFVCRNFGTEKFFVDIVYGNVVVANLLMSILIVTVF